jgi:hypothetical protein
LAENDAQQAARRVANEWGRVEARERLVLRSWLPAPRATADAARSASKCAGYGSIGPHYKESFVARSAFVVIGIVLVLAGCASPRVGTEGYDAALVRKPDPMLPNLFVVDDRFIVIDQEPIHARVRDGKVSIAWALPFPSDFSFPDDRAIVLFGSESNPLPKDLSCGIVGRAARVFTCTYTPSGRARWKYSVRVKKGSTELERLDPWVFND